MGPPKNPRLRISKLFPLDERRIRDVPLDNLFGAVAHEFVDIGSAFLSAGIADVIVLHPCRDHVATAVA